MKFELSIKVENIEQMIIRIFTTIKRFQLNIEKFQKEEVFENNVTLITIQVSGDKHKIHQCSKLLKKTDYINECRVEKVESETYVY
jgi:acetolactate synthase small subunit